MPIFSFCRKAGMAAVVILLCAMAASLTAVQAQDEPNLIGSKPLPGLSGATGWINSKPLTAKELKGKVVLVDFWTYSCINCLRAMPYIEAWAEKYKDSGLVVIGVHTPEFGFEKKCPTCRTAVQKFGITFPSRPRQQTGDLERLPQSILAR